MENARRTDLLYLLMPVMILTPSQTCRFSDEVIGQSCFSVASIGVTLAGCPAYSEAQLDPPSGSVSFREYYRTRRTCRWSFPAFKTLDHVVLLKLTSNGLRNRGCVGVLELPDVGSFCNKPTNSCFVYASLPACNRQMVFDFLRNESCSESYWILNKDMQRYIRFYSTTTTWKSFSFDYKYFSCQEYINRTQSSISASEKNQGPVTSGVSSGALAGVIVLFLILLLASLALLLLLYRRFRRLKIESKPSRVQYELSKPSNTVVVPLNAEQTNESASRESNFALHGEHHNAYHHQVNDPVSSEYSFAVATSQVYPADDQSCQQVSAGCSNDYNSAAVYYGADPNWKHLTALNQIHQNNDTSHQEAPVGRGYGADYVGNNHQMHLNTHDQLQQTNDATHEAVSLKRGYIAMAPLTTCQTDDTMSHEAAAGCSYDYNAPTDYGADINPDCNSFTSDESDQHPAANDEAPTDETAVYAVANKGRATTTR